MPGSMSEEDCQQLYIDKLNVSSISDPAFWCLLKHALAQLTTYSYGDTLPIVSLTLKLDLDRLKERLRHIMALPEFRPDHDRETG